MKQLIDLKTDVMHSLTEEERSTIWNWCNNNLTKIILNGRTDSHWDIFLVDDKRCVSIAKPGSGCDNTNFGTFDYIRYNFNYKIA